MVLFNSESERLTSIGATYSMFPDMCVIEMRIVVIERIRNSNSNNRTGISSIVCVVRFINITRYYDANKRPPRSH